MIIRIHRLAQMQVEYDNNENFTKFLNNIAQANKTTDFTTHAKVEGLQPYTLYYYRISFLNNNNKNTDINKNIYLLIYESFKNKLLIFAKSLYD
jgi:phosphodiesterase/alkaline phosphatase D-like protein